MLSARGAGHPLSPATAPSSPPAPMRSPQSIQSPFMLPAVSQASPSTPSSNSPSYAVPPTSSSTSAVSPTRNQFSFQRSRPASNSTSNVNSSLHGFEPSSPPQQAGDAHSPPSLRGTASKLMEMSSVIATMRSQVLVTEAKQKKDAESSRMVDLKDQMSNLKVDLQAERTLRMELVNEVETRLRNHITTMETLIKDEDTKLRKSLQAASLKIEELVMGRRVDTDARHKSVEELRAQFTGLLDARQNTQDGVNRGLMHEIRQLRDQVEAEIARATATQKAQEDRIVVLERAQARERENGYAGPVVEQYEKLLAYIRALQLDIKAERGNREDAIATAVMRVEDQVRGLREDARKQEHFVAQEILSIRTQMEQEAASVRTHFDTILAKLQREVAGEFASLRLAVAREQEDRQQEQDEIVKHMSATFVDLQRQILDWQRSSS